MAAVTHFFSSFLLEPPFENKEKNELLDFNKTKGTTSEDQDLKSSIYQGNICSSIETGTPKMKIKTLS